MTETNAPTAEAIEIHASYYFQMVVFRVESTLFQVPRHHFESDSGIFRDMFKLRLGGEPAEGNTRERPIHLQGTTVNDFVAFLKLICPKHFRRVESLKPSEWLSVLKLSTMWEFTEARSIAIKTLTTMELDPLDRAEAASAHGVPEWYWCALRELGEAPESPSSKACAQLGLDFGLKVAELRGRIAGYKSAAARSLTPTPAATTKALSTPATINAPSTTLFGSGLFASTPDFPTLATTTAAGPAAPFGSGLLSSTPATATPLPTLVTTTSPTPAPFSFASSSSFGTNTLNSFSQLGVSKHFTPATPSPPILEFIAEIFSEEVKDVPILSCSEDVKKSCRYGQ